MLGTFGDMSTFSFYPSHHITTGEGGALATDNPRLARIACSLRDWGRDCQCTHDSPPEGACGNRFEWQIPGLDEPYDHRYLYVEIGYNMKMTDIQAAIGLAQLKKLPGFIQARKDNFSKLYRGLKAYEEFLLLPSWSNQADPAWFALPLTLRTDAPFTRRDLITHLEGRDIETRLLLAGNLVQQPGYRDIKRRTIGDLPNADRILRSSFFIGVYPGLDEAQIAYVLQAFADFFDHV
jgi:CDP-6-deoxy-D-xylo-4-hexulose-3-dehydrase